jgi:hypothetical protein
MTLARGALVVLASSVASGASAHAQSASAEAMFREGRTLIKQGKLEAGCDKLAASDKLESSVGTLLNLGDCREKLGQTATAWAAFRKAEAMAKRAGDDKKRQAEARRRAQKLEKELSNIVIQVGKTTPGITIQRDGETLDAAVFNTPVPVDPGAHTIIAEAPGFKPYKTEVSVGKGGKRYVVIPVLEREPEPVEPFEPVVVTPAPAQEPSLVVAPNPGDTVMTRDRWSTTRKVAIGVAVMGAAAFGGGIYYGTRANDLQAQSDAICPAIECDDPEGLRLNDEAQRQARNANLLFVGGGAALAAATVMWFVGRPDERAVIAPTLGSGQVGAAFVGRF